MKAKLLLFALGCAQMLSAQWTQLPMPEGGDVQFLGTAHNRVWTECSARNYFSDDQGLTWHKWLLPDSQKARKIWISDTALMAISGWTAQSIYFSTDNGDTWQAVFYDTLHQFHIENVFSAGGYLYFVNGDSFLGNNLYRSGDNGKTWQNVNVDGNGTNYKKLFSVRKGKNALLASLLIDDGIGTPSEYWVRSADFGQTWQKYQTYGFDEHFDSYAMDNCWVFDAYNTSSPIYISYNDGATFSQIPDDPCNRFYFFAPPNNLYAYYNNCITLFNSANQNWQSVPIPPVSFFHFVQTEEGTMLVGNRGAKGVWRKPNNAVGWTDANTGIPSSKVYNLVFHNDHFFLANETGVHRSTDHCQSWNDKSPPEPVYDLHFWGDTLLASGYEKIYFSVDEGKNWATLFQTDPVFGKIKTEGNAMYSAIQVWGQRKILYTPDRGTTSYTIVPPFGSSGASLVDFFVYQGRIWIIMDTKQTFYSDDQGQTWINSGVAGNFRSFFNQNEHFFLNGEQSIYSPDAGLSWFPSMGLPAGKSITCIKNDKNNRWYAAIEGAGIFTSIDFGAHWNFGDDPGNPDVFLLFPFGNELYASRYPEGLWRRSLITSSITTPEESSVSDLVISPNPTHHEVEIIWPTNTPPETPLFVYDLYGKLILQIENQHAASLRVDVSTWPAGFYFVMLGEHVARLLKH